MWKWNAFKECESKMLEVKITPINTKMINFDEYIDENKTKHNKNWPHILDHPYRILIIGG